MFFKWDYHPKIKSAALEIGCTFLRFEEIQSGE